MSKIRLAKKSDFDDINSVISANRSNKADIYHFPYWFGSYQEILPKNHEIIFVTEENFIVIAFLVLHNNDLYKNLCTAKFEMVVHPDYRDRKKHHGEALLKKTINYTEVSTKVNTLITPVSNENIPSINLLKKLGFSCEKDKNSGSGCYMKLTINR